MGAAPADGRVTYCTPGGGGARTGGGGSAAAAPTAAPSLGGTAALSSDRANRPRTRGRASARVFLHAYLIRFVKLRSCRLWRYLRILDARSDAVTRAAGYSRPSGVTSSNTRAPGAHSGGGRAAAAARSAAEEERERPPRRVSSTADATRRRPPEGRAPEARAPDARAPEAREPEARAPGARGLEAAPRPRLEGGAAGQRRRRRRPRRTTTRQTLRQRQQPRQPWQRLQRQRAAPGCRSPASAVAAPAVWRAGRWSGTRHHPAVAEAETGGPQSRQTRGPRPALLPTPAAATRRAAPPAPPSRPWRRRRGAGRPGGGRQQTRPPGRGRDHRASQRGGRRRRRRRRPGRRPGQPGRRRGVALRLGSGRVGEEGRCGLVWGDRAEKKGRARPRAPRRSPLPAPRPPWGPPGRPHTARAARRTRPHMRAPTWAATQHTRGSRGGGGGDSGADARCLLALAPRIARGRALFFPAGRHTPHTRHHPPVKCTSGAGTSGRDSRRKRSSAMLLLCVAKLARGRKPSPRREGRRGL